ncbi:PREDICTED: uncharacterized protein LOC105564534 [Vollenhovia emeryi]|uniref:uncharacterized protein LOC105564534 n=1 Tax=Vollenhovia emeryi TaxID=411798 RepID=UPI0005F52948|nr:PREDICTED: uncharacterized protein LOC105564534 [Vollenhovia emeryi]
MCSIIHKIYNLNYCVVCIIYNLNYCNWILVSYFYILFYQIVLDNFPIDNLLEVLHKENKIEEIVTRTSVENIVTSSQHSSQTISNEITASTSSAERLFQNDQLQGHSRQLSTLSSFIQLPQSELNLNIFSRYGSVEKTLENHVQGASILKAARKGSFNESDRRALVRIVVAELILAQNNNYYPPDEAKVSLASAIVSEFPLLRHNVKGFKGYEHYYDPKTRQGFIEYRLWTVRTKLSPRKKKYSAMALKRKAQCLKENYKVSGNDMVLLQESILEEKLSWMKHKMPSDSNKELIKNCLAETFPNRRQ